MSEKSIKTAAELESIVTTELREHSECDGAGVVVIRPMGLSWDAALVGDGPTLYSECNRRLAEITTRLRREFDLAEQIVPRATRCPTVSNAGDKPPAFLA
jgi:hypothetical protein